MHIQMRETLQQGDEMYFNSTNMQGRFSFLCSELKYTIKRICEHSI